MTGCVAFKCKRLDDFSKFARSLALFSFPNSGHDHAERRSLLCVCLNPVAFEEYRAFFSYVSLRYTSAETVGARYSS